MENVILNIGGFYILIKFLPFEIGLEKVRMPDYIKWKYKSFIPDSPSKKIDYEIKFINVKNMRSLVSADKKHLFINLYDKIGPRSIVTFYHISMFQLDIILTHILQELLEQDNGFIIHSSSSSINSRAYLFMGQSGAGKSTLTKLLSVKYKPLADDSSILRRIGNRYYFFQTPFSEKNGQIKKTPERMEIGGIYFIFKSKNFKLEKIRDKGEVLEKISKQLYSQQDGIQSQMIKMINFINSNEIFYNFWFNKDAKKALNFFKQNEYNL